MYKSLTELYYQLEAPPNRYNMMGYNQMMMQPQQMPMMQQPQMHRPMMPSNMPQMAADGNAGGTYSMDQIRYLRQQEQLRYSQLNVSSSYHFDWQRVHLFSFQEAGSSGTNRGTIISEAQKRFMNSPMEIVELD